jgi:hypothetical protein
MDNWEKAFCKEEFILPSVEDKKMKQTKTKSEEFQESRV